jgi:hypothetical protein
MAKASGLGDNFYIGGYDLSGDVASIDKISGPTALLEATTIKQLAEARLPGKRDGVMQFTTLFNNTGTTNTPAVPATTVNQTNVNAWPVFVTITGGTITSVKVNGVQVGTTAGTYAVPAGQPISITYSSAPTWAWSGVLAEHNALSSLPRTDEIATYLRGTAQGNVAASCKGLQLNYDPTRDNTGQLTMQVEVDADGFGVEWGYQLTPGLRADTAATVGAAYDDTTGSGGTAFGAQAYLNLVALVGTNVDVSITHSTTSGGTYTSLMDFGSLSAIGSARQSVSNITTVNEFLKVVTTGTFTYAQFAVVFVRNKTAGQVF